MFESLNSIAPHAKSGTVRALAVSGARRSPGFPDLPTVAEAGVPGYDAPTWSGVIGPAGVPRPIVDKLNAAINRRSSRRPSSTASARSATSRPAARRREFGEVIRMELAKWADVVKRTGGET